MAGDDDIAGRRYARVYRTSGRGDLHDFLCESVESAGLEAMLNAHEALRELQGDQVVSQFQRGRGYVARYYDRTALADQMLGTLLRFGQPETPLPSEVQPEFRKAA